MSLCRSSLVSTFRLFSKIQALEILPADADGLVAPTVAAVRGLCDACVWPEAVTRAWSLRNPTAVSSYHAPLLCEKRLERFILNALNQ